MVVSFLIAGTLLYSAPGSESCRACHAAAVDGYLQTGMGDSVSRPATGLEGAFDHPRSGSSFAIKSSPTGMVQSVERGSLEAEYPIEYVIGSGNAAFGFLVRIDDYVYQSPVSFYTKRQRWDMAPGFERHPAPDFDRPVLHECLWCHAGRPRPVPFTQNRYADPILELEAISCDRCHGPAEAHLAAPSSETIVNPPKLPPAERDSVCEQCHLGGGGAVLNPGESFGDFRPGDRLEDVFSVYVDDFGPVEPGRFKVVSHFEQLALSRCYQESGEEMWCGTCHSPHDKPQDPPSHYRSRCLSCHDENLIARHSQPADDCVSCHMTRKPSYDSGHSAFTDHLIALYPVDDAERERTAKRIRAWRNPDDPELARRNLGLAYVRLGRRKQNPAYMDEGASLLAGLAQAGSLDAEGLEALGSTLLTKIAPPEAGLKELAAELLQLALHKSPGVPERYRTVAASEWEAGNSERAVELLNHAITLDPQNRAAYEVLARIHLESNRRREAVSTWNRYLKLVPLSLSAREAMRDLTGDVTERAP